MYVCVWVGLKDFAWKSKLMEKTLIYSRFWTHKNLSDPMLRIVCVVFFFSCLILHSFPVLIVKVDCISRSIHTDTVCVCMQMCMCVSVKEYMAYLCSRQTDRWKSAHTVYYLMKEKANTFFFFATVLLLNFRTISTEWILFQWNISVMLDFLLNWQFY